MVTLAVDAMGGDYGPRITVPATLDALKRQSDLRVLLFGDQDKIAPFLVPLPADRFQIVHTRQAVDMGDSPSRALRAKKDSSMALMLKAVKEGLADGCVSGGNTGALMVLSRSILKTSESIDRPAIVSALPREDGGHTFMLDLGANVGSDSEQLYQFAIMGQAFAQVMDGRTFPRIALLNIGSEEIKGNDQVKAASDLLKADSSINYVGFVEGSDLFRGQVDVVVCDGFVGNVALKTVEGLARFIMAETRKEFSRTPWHKLLGFLFSPVWRNVEKRINPGAYNGAVLAGLKGVVVKSHGDADAEEYCKAILSARDYVDKQLPQRIESLIHS